MCGDQSPSAGETDRQADFLAVLAQQSEAGDLTASYRLATIMRHADPVESARLLHHAAKLGHVRAQADLALDRYERGEITMVQLQDQLPSRRASDIGIRHDGLSDVLRAIDNYAPLDLEGCAVAGLDLDQRDLSGANVSSADLSGVSLRGAALRWALIDGADFSNAQMTMCDLRLARGERPRFVGADLTGSDLTGVVFVRADLDGACLDYVDVDGASLQGFHAPRVDLRKALNINGADLTGANLEAADLRSLDLAGAVLAGANLRNADLRGAVFEGASLAGASLNLANLSGADFYGADLSATQMLGCKGLGEAILIGADLPPSISAPETNSSSDELQQVIAYARAMAVDARSVQRWSDRVQAAIIAVIRTEGIEVAAHELAGAGTVASISWQPDTTVAIAWLSDAGADLCGRFLDYLKASAASHDGPSISGEASGRLWPQFESYAEDLGVRDSLPTGNLDGLVLDEAIAWCRGARYYD